MDFNKIIHNTRDRNTGMDFKSIDWPAMPEKTWTLIKEIKQITKGKDKVQKGLKILMGFMPDRTKDYNNIH